MKHKPNYPFTGNRFRDMAITQAWARDLIAAPNNWLILDTETTSLNGLILELALLKPNGEPAFNSLLNPRVEIGKQAFETHGISSEMVKDAPVFAKYESELRSLMHGKTIVVYNVEFDWQRLHDELVRFYMERKGFDFLPPVHRERPYTDLEHLKDAVVFADEWLAKCDWECAMEHNNALVGNWIQGENRYKRQRLSGGHRAIYDCMATLKLIERMAEPMEARIDKIEN